MAYRSVHGSTYPHTRESFGRRPFDHARPPRGGVSRAAFLGTLAAALLFALWSGATTFYLVFRDDILRQLATRQIEMSRAQDAQIAALNAEIERLRSTKFVDQERIERQLADLTRIQRLIDARHSALSALAQSVARNPETTGAVPAASVPLRAAPAPAEQTAPDAKPRPLSDATLIDPPLERTATVQSRIILRAAIAPEAGEDKRVRQLAAIERALTKLGTQQAEALNALEGEIDERAARTRRAIAALGPHLPPAPRARKTPVGGPFIPYHGASEDGFMQQVFRVRTAAAEQERLRRRLEGLPILLPVLGDVEITSSFGPRVDPFLKRLAMHAGVDLRGETGDPVRAAAAGTVIHAGRHSAYGLMVEIDHGNGLSTRYAHLSRILVKEGASLAAGAIVGKIGSTGRSTAPHLHYEVRMNGDPVDPRRYLRAAQHLSGLE